jgi:hypothetical protein
VEPEGNGWLPSVTADSWEFTHESGLRFLVAQVTPQKHMLYSWVELRWPGPVPAAGVIYAGRHDLMSGRTVSAIVAAITRRKLPVKADWDHLVEVARYDVLTAHLEGPRPVTLSGVEPHRGGFVLRPLISSVGATSIVGGGGVGKSMLVLAGACTTATGNPDWIGMEPRTTGHVIYCDWEADAQTHSERLHSLARGLGIDPPGDTLQYLRHPLPLRQWAPALAREVARSGTVLVIIDSVMLARAGEAGAEETIAFFGALSQLGCPSLLVDHKSRAALAEGRSGAYGSVINDNSVRLMWDVLSSPGSNTLTLKPTKANNYSLRELPTISLSLDVQTTTAGRAARWVHVTGESSISQQVRDTIATNPAGLTADAVTRLVGAKHDTVTRTLRRLENTNDIQRVGDLFLPLDAPY